MLPLAAGPTLGQLPLDHRRQGPREGRREVVRVEIGDGVADHGTAAAVRADVGRHVDKIDAGHRTDGPEVPARRLSGVGGKAAVIERVAKKKLAQLGDLEPLVLRRRLFAFLARRGYDLDEIKAVVTRLAR